MNIKITLAALSALALCSCTNNMKRVTKAEFSGEDLTAIARVERNSDSKAVKLKIKEDVSWEIYGGESIEQINFKKPLSKGKKAGEYEVDVPNGGRYYFQLITSKGNAILSERQLPMAGGYNFRDLGGRRTKDGRYVKWGKIFRSDDLFNLTDDDLSYLSSIPIKSIVDFRRDDEIMEAPDKLPESVEHIYAYSISPGNMNETMAKADPSQLEDVFIEEMLQMNVRMVTDPKIVEQYRKFFALLANDDNMPTIFHCAAGKDRTGMAAALILYALGVDDETILRDYLRSNTLLAGKYSSIIEKNPAFEPLMVVHQDYLKAGLDQINSSYGSVDSYLQDVLEVDIDAIREKYLY